VALGLAVSIVLAAAPIGDSGAEPFPAAGLQPYLTGLGFSAAELRDMRAGSVVTRVLEEKDDNAAFVVGVAHVTGSEEALADEIRGIAETPVRARVLQSGRFGISPSVEDLRPLTFEPKDLDELRECQVGDCGLKADAGMIAIGQTVDWNAPTAMDEAEQMLKRALVGRVQDYLERGAAGMVVYRDNEDPERTAEEFAKMLRESPHLVERNPAFYEHLLEFPKGASPPVEDFVYWSKQRMRKPVVSLVHVCLQRVESGGRARYFIALKHIFDSHFFLAYAEFVETVPCTPPATGFYLVRSIRARIDPPHWFRGLLLGKIKRAMRDALAEDLAHSQSRLEAGGPPPAGAGVTPRGAPPPGRAARRGAPEALP
jgi:hypothetical protein